MKIDVKDCCASPGLISVDEALVKLLQPVIAVADTETVRIEEAAGRVLAEEIRSTIDVPGYDNSAMDGYAVNSVDCVVTGAKLPVTQRIPAGQTGVKLERGTAARIFTGAPVPEGADAVVMQERCDREGDVVTINTAVKAGSNVRRAGEDIASGSVVLEAGVRLRAQELGLIASVGIADVAVKRRLTVACFFTGDELVEPGKPLEAGQIYNSNRYTILGLLKSVDCEIIDLGIVPDTLDATVVVLQKAADTADLVITSGGVSVGEEDYVRIALQQLGELTMWRIAMKPGKPVAYGKVGKALFIGLPGNPVSVFVTFLLFARPLILKMQGAEKHMNAFTQIRADFDWPGGGRQEYLRVRLEQSEAGTVARLYPHQGSGVLSSASWADGFVEVKIGEVVKPGDLVSFMSFGELYR